ncbi:carotenoid 1,2-hydratase [Ramlibacter sp. 2FC]|uniref:lipocalin-like domain-containing protein n=1 Tax=Ramlibacter sp. 2FC TaxID=2502188 RepID=UPI0010F906D8|nr:carotenoid 1,2-hydratase [Ramlibacter sp. 2FC]
MLARRPLLIAAGLAPLGALALPPRRLQFPRDHGAHPEFRTEWWYLTGHARAAGREFGFQITFFRSRVDATQAMRSRFAARQLLFAHAAITDVQGRRLWHDQRIARSLSLPGLDRVIASEADTGLRLNDWSLRRQGGVYLARVEAGEFALQLEAEATQPLLLQGEQGLSRKGPEPGQASYYYSRPQLAVRGELRLKGQRFSLTEPGRAWLDHEWSEALMHPEARGWDWIGMNLFDGSALTSFRLRRADGSALWDGGSFRTAEGRLQVFRPGETRFVPQRRWTSPLSRAAYPVAWQLQTPAGEYGVRAVLDDQELDSRGSTGAIYWEGLSELLDGQSRPLGRGYLEMTGYAQPLKL